MDTPLQLWVSQNPKTDSIVCNREPPVQESIRSCIATILDRHQLFYATLQVTRRRVSDGVVLSSWPRPALVSVRWLESFPYFDVLEYARSVDAKEVHICAAVEQYSVLQNVFLVPSSQRDRFTRQVLSQGGFLYSQDDKK